MKRLILVLTVMVFGAVLVSAQSLADAAQQAKTQKNAVPAKHVYTNDDIASTPAPAVQKAAGATSPSGDAATTGTDGSGTDAAKADGSKNDDKAAANDKDKKDSKEDAATKAAAYKQKLEDQKKAIADQEREINLMEREHQVRVATYYADAGNQLRTGEKWFQDEKKYQDDLAAKKKALTDAKAKLDETSEQARKAGIPASQQ